MGIFYSIYIGPFIKCKTQKMMDSTEIIGCGNGDCQDFQKSVYDKGKNFCPSCGAPLEKQDVEYERDNVSPFDFAAEKLNEALYETSGNMMGEDREGEHVWLPNQNREGFQTFGGDPKCDDLYLEIQELDSQAELEGFKQAYAAEIALIKEEYGPDNVEIVWGFFNSAS